MKKATTASSSEMQTLFDQMFAMAVDHNGDPVLPDSNPKPNTAKPFQNDPMDMVLLVEGHLKKALVESSSEKVSSLQQIQSRLEQCKLLITDSNTTTNRLSPASLDWINNLMKDAQLALDFSIAEELRCSGYAPLPLHLTGLVGGMRLAEIEAEEVWMVRGANYLQDCVKIPAGPPLFHLRGMQVVEHPKGVAASSTTHVAMQEWCGFPKSHDHCNEWLIVNYMVPGSTAVNVVCLYTASQAAREVIASLPHKVHPGSPSHRRHRSAGVGPEQRCPVHHGAGWANAIYRFWGGDDAYRNRSFKLFPRLCKSSWAIQAAVGKKPALIGNKKLELTYTRSNGYLEIDIDLSSSSIATHILGMVRGVSKSMVVDLGIGIEGTQADELPEAILCETRFDRVDLDGGAPLPVPGALKAGADACNAGAVASAGAGGASPTAGAGAVHADGDGDGFEGVKGAVSSSFSHTAVSAQPAGGPPTPLKPGGASHGHGSPKKAHGKEAVRHSPKTHTSSAITRGVQS